MKKITIAMSALLFLYGCEIDDLQESVVNKLIFTASMEDSKTKTYIEDGNLLRWNKDDRISLFAGNTLNSEYKFDGHTGDNSGTFSPVNSSYGTGNELSYNYAVYPYNKWTEITESGTIYVSLPAKQTYSENSFGLGANTMVAITKDVNDMFLPFKNVCGYIKIQLYGSDINVRSITFKGNTGERITGEAKINVSDPNNPKISTTSDAEKVIVLDCGENGVEIGDSVDEATSFWIVVPPKTFTEGFTISILTSDDKEIIKSTKKSITVERNTIIPMKAFEISFLPEVVPDYQWYIDADGDEYHVSNAKEFVALAKLSRGDADALTLTGEGSPVTFEGKLISLTSDIDLSVCCSEASATSWEPIENFMGTLDGNNHIISNLFCNTNANMGLFNNLTDAQISNLHVEGTIRRVCQGNESNPCIGGISARATNTIFENCISNVQIETSSDRETCPIAMPVGGICGDATSCVFLACQSSSTITDKQGEREFRHYLGGIVGYAHTCKVIACVKLMGDVIQQSTAYCYVGGIVGYIAYGDSSMIRSCYSAVKVAGRQPGQILGAYGTSIGTPNIQSCYYSGPSFKGVGSQFYGGSEYSYDYGTGKSIDIVSEISDMNTTIDQWNQNYPEYYCNYVYALDSNNQPELSHR